GLNSVVRLLVANGDRALVEAPTYDRMLHVLGDRGADVVAVPRTDAGLDLDRLAALAGGRPRPRFLYVLPTFHNATGRTLSRAAREELVELVVEHELLVFEDDPYGLVRIEGEPEPFFFQAEDGIRDGHVTGVQTCALPISTRRSRCSSVA